MNCFYHPTVVAVGICKSCEKGLCTSCFVDLDKGLACKNRCEEDVDNMVKLIDYNVSMIGTNKSLVNNARRAYLGNGIFYLAFGILVLLVGLGVSLFTADGIGGGIIPLILAVLFLAFGLFYVKRGLSIPAKPDTKAP